MWNELGDMVYGCTGFGWLFGFMESQCKKLDSCKCWFG